MLLLASVGVTAVAAFNAQRAVRSHQRTASRLLRDYASFTAWTSQRQVGDGLDGAVMASLQYIMHGRELHQFQRNGPRPNADDLWRYYNDSDRFRTRFCTPKRCPESFPPSVYFGFTLGADTLRVAPRAAVPEADAWLEVAPAVRQAMARRLADDAHPAASTIPNENYEVLVSPRFGTGRMIAYALMPTEAGDTVVYGVEFGAKTSRHIFKDAVVHEHLLPNALMLGKDERGPARHPHRGSALAAAVRVAANGRRRRTSGRSSSRRISAGSRVQTAIRPEYANQLVIGGLPRSRLPLLLGMLVVSAALAVVAVIQLRREEELARLRSDFVSSVSHELRTPLAQIRLFLETLRLGRFTTDAQRQWSLDNIDRETNRLAHLVENVLYFARAGRAPSSARDAGVDGPRVPRSSRSRARSSRWRRRAVRRCTLELAPNVVVPLQREAFRQVLLNLLDNAVKYGPAGQTVRVSLAQPGSSARVTVADEGPGVPGEGARGDLDAVLPRRRGGGAGRRRQRHRARDREGHRRAAWAGASTSSRIGERGAAFHVEIPWAQRVAAPAPRRSTPP